VIYYANKQLAKQEKNYPQFLVVMAAMIWAMEYFDNPLSGKGISQCLEIANPLKQRERNMKEHYAESKKHACNGILKPSTKGM
jgi:hypothetical protein